VTAIGDVAGVWRLTIGEGREEALVNLATDADMVGGEFSSPRMGTIAISGGSVDHDLVKWTVPVRSPVVIDLEFSLQVQGDTMTGESRAGAYRPSVVRGVRATASDWTPWPPPHVHRSVVRLPEGTTVTAVSFDANDPYRRDQPPDFGLYLDARWAPPWPHEHLDWPDFGIPREPELFAGALEGLLLRARAGQRVEIGCLGGHGRTGTALAWLAVLSGTAPDEAVVWVRSNYCVEAVETPEQEAFVGGLGT
jgi:hypothetical protein